MYQMGQYVGLSGQLERGRTPRPDGDHRLMSSIQPATAGCVTSIRPRARAHVRCRNAKGFDWGAAELRDGRELCLGPPVSKSIQLLSLTALSCGLWCRAGSAR